MRFQTDCFRKFDYALALREDPSSSSPETVVIIMKPLISSSAFIYDDSTYLLHLALSLTHPSPFPPFLSDTHSFSLYLHFFTFMSP